METKPTIIRLLLTLWLLSSQIAGAALMFAPLVVLFTFSDMRSDPNPGGLTFLLGMGYVLPFFFIGLAIAAWVAFARRKNGSAGLLGLATLVPGGIMLLAINIFTS